MPFIPQNDDFTAEKIIFEFKSIQKLEEQIKFVLLQLYSLEKSSQELFRNQIIEYEKLLNNPKFMRQIRYRDNLVEDYGVEYFGDDFGEDDPFIYNEELEIQIIKISMKLLATIGLIAKSLKEQNIVIGDDA